MAIAFGLMLMLTAAAVVLVGPALVLAFILARRASR
jgi:hypothetical protein